MDVAHEVSAKPMNLLKNQEFSIPVISGDGCLYMIILRSTMLYCIVLYCTGIVFCVVFYCAIRVGQISSKFIGGTAMKNPMHAFCYAGHQRIDVGNNVRNCHKDRKLPFAFSLVSSFPKFSIVFFWRFGDIARTCLDQNFTSTTVSGFLKAKVRGQISCNLPERWVSSCFIHGLDRFGPPAWQEFVDSWQIPMLTNQGMGGW